MNESAKRYLLLEGLRTYASLVHFYSRHEITKPLTRDGEVVDACDHLECRQARGIMEKAR